MEAWSSSTRTPAFGTAIWLQSDVFDWRNHREKPDHFMEEKYILHPPHPPRAPPQVRKLQVKPITGMVQKNMHSNRAGWEGASSCVVGIPSLTLLPGLMPSSLALPAVLGSVPSPFPTCAGSTSTLAGGGQRLVDWGLEAAYVLYRGTVCFH